MKYSLRSMIILAAVLPSLTFCVLVVWTYLELSANYQNAPIQRQRP